MLHHLFLKDPRQIDKNDPIEHNLQEPLSFYFEIVDKILLIINLKSKASIEYKKISGTRTKKLLAAIYLQLHLI